MIGYNNITFWEMHSVIIYYAYLKKLCDRKRRNSGIVFNRMIIKE